MSAKDRQHTRVASLLFASEGVEDVLPAHPAVNAIAVVKRTKRIGCPSAAELGIRLILFNLTRSGLPGLAAPAVGRLG
jgi:hypothetical protein